MNRLAVLIAELEGMAREYGAPVAGELWEKDIPTSTFVGKSGKMPLRKELGLDDPDAEPDDPDAEPDEKDDKKKEKDKEKEKSTSEIKREHLAKAATFAQDVLKQLGLKTSRVRATTSRGENIRMNGKPGDAIAMWDDEHTVLLTVFIGDDGVGKASAMKVTKDSKKLNKDLDFSERGIDSSSREVTSFVRGI